MTDQIIESSPWLDTPAGRYLLDWERAQMASAVADVFGFHALQLGLAALDALADNRMPHRWLATQQMPGRAVVDAFASSAMGLDGHTDGTPGDSAPVRQPDLLCDYAALPFPPESLDLIVMPHTLELTADPHGVLREVHRVLVPEGRVVITGFNPVSLWAWRQQRGRWLRRWGVGEPFLAHWGEFIGLLRLRDWLRLLNLDVGALHFGCFRPAMDRPDWMDKLDWMDRLGSRAWPFLGAVYALTAVKRVHGATLLEPGWRTPRALTRSAVVGARRSHPQAARGHDA